jgi:hypothetical protein
MITRQVFGATCEEDLKEAVKAIPTEIMIEELWQRAVFHEQQLDSIGQILKAVR